VEEGGFEDPVALGVAPDVVEEEFVVVFPIAAAWNAANLVPGLMAKTMPCWQWPVWRQYTQTGLVSVTWNCACWKGPLVLFSDTGMLKEGIRLEEGVKKRKETRDLQARVEATGRRRTGVSEGGLCCRVILLHENEGNDVSGVGILVMDGHLEVKTGHNTGNLPPRKGCTG
jgi:hypothetical protein